MSASPGVIPLQGQTNTPSPQSQSTVPAQSQSTTPNTNASITLLPAVWPIAFFALWLILSAISENEDTKQFGQTLSVTIAFAMTILLGPQALSNFSHTI